MSQTNDRVCYGIECGFTKSQKDGSASIVAKRGEAGRVRVPYNYDLNDADNYFAAARALLAKIEQPGAWEIVCGVFVGHKFIVSYGRKVK